MNRPAPDDGWREIAKALQQETDTARIIDLARKLEEELRKRETLGATDGSGTASR
jgi:hypothetical protein